MKEIVNWTPGGISVPFCLCCVSLSDLVPIAISALMMTIPKTLTIYQMKTVFYVVYVLVHLLSKCLIENCHQDYVRSPSCSTTRGHSWAFFLDKDELQMILPYVWWNLVDNYSSWWCSRWQLDRDSWCASTCIHTWVQGVGWRGLKASLSP